MKYIFYLSSVLFFLNYNCVAQTHFSIGSSKQEVIRVQGRPESSNKYQALGYEIWNYGYSSVKFSVYSEKVIEWSNIGHNLKVKLLPGPNITNNDYFTVNSHKDDVLRLQGTPDNISKYPALGYELLDYGYSSVKISVSTNKVMEWSNISNNLKVRLLPGERITDSKTFTIGSHKDDVLRLQGTPDNISKYPALGYELLDYGYSSVKISVSTNKVMEWNNISNNLKVSLLPGENITNSKTFTIGSHKDDVLRLQGTPDNIGKYPALGYEILNYGYSTIKISLSSLKVLSIYDLGNLVCSKSASTASNTKEIKYHKKIGDVTLLYDENKIYSDVFLIKIEDDDEVYGFSDNGFTYYFDKNLKPLDIVSYYESENELNIVPISKTYNSQVYSELRNKLTNISISGDVSINGTAQKIGDITFYNLTTDYGEYISGTSMDINNISFDNFYSSEGTSISGDRIKIGNFSFGNWWDSNNQNISGSSQKIGNMIFHNYYGSDGSIINGTTMEIGNFTYSNYNEW